MELTGHPPVPPKEVFGLWISEYGYDNWGEIESKLATLRANHFPVDGFVLDLQWFGGASPQAPTTATWGRSHGISATFKGRRQVSVYRNHEGLGIIAIEEIVRKQEPARYANLQNPGAAARHGCIICEPRLSRQRQRQEQRQLVGQGGMIDWTSDEAGDFWRDLKRQPLIANGVIGHWIDLGEPGWRDSDESGGDRPTGWLGSPGKHAHAEYHNVYNLKWAESIARGYQRNGVGQRPFIMARSGAAGIQRYGVAMWSADIGTNLGNLAAHLNAQMRMSFFWYRLFWAPISAAFLKYSAAATSARPTRSGSPTA